MNRVVIAVENVTKKFRHPLPHLRRLLRRPGEIQVAAIKDVSLKIQQGEIFGLVGPNGAGKTTLLKLIATLLEPTCGSVGVLGFDSVQQSNEVKRCIGLVTSDERSFYWRLTGRQNLKFFARLHGLEKARAVRRIEELLEAIGLKEMGDYRFHEFSSGSKQRLAIVRALLPNPPILLLDEPTRSLDPIAAAALRQLVRERVNTRQLKAVLLTSHDLSEIEQLCERVALLSHGELKACATLSGLRARYAQQEQVTLQVRHVSTRKHLDTLRSLIPALEWETISSDTHEIRFSQHIGDGELSAVLKRLLDSGAIIVSCNIEQFGLREVMEQLER